MNLAIWTVARRLALSTDRRQRWRQISIVAGALIATCAVLLAMSIIHLGLLTSDHTGARHPVVDSGESRMTVAVTGPILPDLSQFPVLWLDPAPGSEDDPAIIPPGLSALPAPGEAVLSPGLLARGYTAEDLGFAPSRAGTGLRHTIGDAGLASRSEGFVVARAPEGRSLGEHAIASSGFRGPGPRYPVETVLDVPAAGAAIVGAIWLLMLPALMVLTGSARAVSQVRTERAETLWRLGVRRRGIGLLVALETLVLATIGSALGVLLWGVAIAPRTHLPGIGASLLPGALDLPGLAVAAGVALVLLNATLAALWAKREPSRPRGGVSVLRVLPFAACLAVMTLAGWVPQLLRSDAGYDLGVTVLMVAGAGATITLPMAVPPLLGGMATVGRLLRQPTAWLAGRLVVARRSTLARPAVMAAVLVYLAGATTAMIAGLTENAPVSVLPSAQREVWVVTWADSRADDIDTAAERARQAGAETLAVTPTPAAEAGPEPSDGIVTTEDCAAARQFFGLDEQTMTCTNEEAAAPGLWFTVRFGSAENREGTISAAATGMLVSAPPGWTEADTLAVFSGLPVVNPWKVAGTSDFFSPVYDWLAGAMIAATGILAIGLVREIGDRVLVVVGERSRLLRAGLRDGESDWVYGLATLLPMAVALPLGYLSARIFAANGTGYAVTADSVDIVAMVAALVAGLTAAVVALTLWWQRRIDTGRGES
ncbi:hypothetical protein [Myceligenerans indicum]|uniref:ABC transporter permease n=1 Tax=Myceligenerans indicum TaxID=2593663 RepID=A0ABS1LLL1_9MICO|nr:hypothetical protein [Myceligenerans indicum]MBL0887145.1 hypothetical protein [Myceligenerans indicum]